MTNLTAWAARWGVPFQALEDLRREMGIATDPAATSTGKSEASVQAEVRREASRKGARLWRNNVGATPSVYECPRCMNRSRVVPVRYGLANDSSQLNDVCKSSDLIGIRPVVIEPYMIGRTLGLFVARETKAQGWKHAPGNKREAAQLAFLDLVLSLGGDAAFCTGEGSL